MNDNYFITLIKTHKLLFVLISLSVIAASILLSLLFISMRTTTLPDTFVETPTITPGIAKDNLTILNVTPKNNATNIQIFQQIAITFSRPVTSTEKAIIKIVSNPPIKGSSQWSASENVLFIYPSEALLPNQRYVLTAIYYDQSFPWSFTTVPIQDVSTKDQIQAQEQADRNYGEAIEKLDSLYPWLQSLPIQDEQYFVFFDPETKQMTAYLYPDSSSQLSLNEQTALMKTEILSRLQELEINTDQYTPLWLVL